MAEYNYIIWDWNGTLLDDVGINLEITNILLDERKLPLLHSKEKYRKLFTFPVINYYYALGFTFEDESFEELAREYAFLYDERYPSASVSCETENLLRKLKQAGIGQLIVSATEQAFLQKQVRYFEIEHLFTDILGTSDIYVRSKVNVAERWLSENGVSPDEVLLIGDTVHDKEVADSIGCDCILIPQGHQSEGVLLASGAKLVKNISDIEKEVIK